jgi:hypothetical protein
MYRNQLENTIKQLKEIRPNQEWVSLLKSQILNSVEQNQTIKIAEVPIEKVKIVDIISRIIFQNKLAYATVTTLLFMVVGVFGFVNYTMPGDIFYPVKRIVEQTQSQSAVQIAYNRSEDLVKIIKENKTQNLAPAITEYKASISDAVKDLSDSLAQNNDKKIMEEIINDVIKIKENQRNLQVLGVNVGDEDEVSELVDLLSAIVKNQIADFEDTTLTQEQQKVLAEVKELNEQEKYSEALELILEIEKIK